MADIEYFDDDAGYGRGIQRDTYGYENQAQYRAAGQGAHGAGQASGAPGLGRAVNWAGAIVSLGLVVGMSFWAWQLTMRDVSGVPVIRALEGPMRVAPENPGGAQAPHQGLAVNRIAEGAEAEAVPDRLVLAPPPVDLEAVDLGTPAAPDSGASPETQALIDNLLDRGGPALAPVAPATPRQPDIAEMAPEPAPSPAPEAVSGIIPVSVPGVSRSLRPSSRPAGLDTTSVNSSASTAITPTAAPAPTASSGVTDLTLADLPEGTRLVQLGAFDSAEIARTEWDRLAARFPDYFAGRARIVQQASSGGQDFFRLRAHGFDDLDASRRFCAAMVSQGAACIPVTIR